MKSVLTTLLIVTLFLATPLRAETEEPLEDLDSTELSPSEPNLGEPRSLDEVADAESVVVEEKAVRNEVGLDGRPVSPALLQMRELEEENGWPRFSLGLGTSYFLRDNIYFQGNLEWAFARHLSLGLMGVAMGSFGTSGTVQVHEAFGTVNLHSSINFRGLWIQGGGGYMAFKEVPSGQTPGEVHVYPALMGAVGWRWVVPDTNGNDDNFSVSLSGGIQTALGSINVASINSSLLLMLPFVRFELNFGF